MLNNRYMKIFFAFILTSLFVGSSLSASAQTFRRPQPSVWYRLMTRYNGTDQRVGRCIQYFPAGSEHPNMLWSAPGADFSSKAYDYQLWKFETSPTDSARYKMVCKAAPNGFVNPVPTADNASARWLYVASEEDSKVNPYGFIFVTEPTMSGIDSSGYSYCALATDSTINNYYWLMNCGAARQDYAINLWSDDYSEDANEWLFRFEEKAPLAADVINTLQPDGEVYYDLFGRRVVNPSRGIYIYRGKKVLLK